MAWLESSSVLQLGVESVRVDVVNIEGKLGENCVELFELSGMGPDIVMSPTLRDSEQWYVRIFIYF